MASPPWRMSRSRRISLLAGSLRQGMLRLASLGNNIQYRYRRKSPMTIEQLIENVADYGRDIKLNFSTHVRQQTELTPQQTWGTVLASAIATGKSELIGAAEAQAREFLSPEA